MNDPREREVEANLARAQSSLAAARVLLDAGHPDEAASRAYYAAFYAATAALLREGLDFGKHSGVIAAVHQRFVKTGRLEKSHGRSLNWLFELRSIGDCGETQHVPREEAERALAAAADFAAAVRKLSHPSAPEGS